MPIIFVSRRFTLCDLSCLLEFYFYFIHYTEFGVNASVLLCHNMFWLSNFSTSISEVDIVI